MSIRPLLPFLILSATAAIAAAPKGTTANPLPPELLPVIDDRCSACHNDEDKKGGLDFAALAFAPSDARNFATWVKVVDRVAADEMPPKKKPRLAPAEKDAFMALSNRLIEAETSRLADEGRATRRRLNRYEYEATLRDLLQAPWLQIRDTLPEDGELHRFNKIGEALDVSHVQMARYLTAAESALRQAMDVGLAPQAPTVKRYYARDQRGFIARMLSREAANGPERCVYPMLGTQTQPDVRSGKAPLHGAPEDRDLEGMGVVASAYEPLEPKFLEFKAPQSGRYRLRLNAFTVWVKPTKKEGGKRWWIPDFDDVAEGRRTEPVTIYSELPVRQMRRLDRIDVTPEPNAYELESWLQKGETIRVDAARLFRSRAASFRFRNPLAEPDGQPGVVYRWLDVEGPLVTDSPAAIRRLLFDDLPIAKRASAEAPLEVVSKNPTVDAPRLLRAFMAKVYRQPLGQDEHLRFLQVINAARAAGRSFTDAMLTGYTAVLCSPRFLYLQERAGALDDYALATRLSYFLWNSAPDDELRALAARGKLHAPDVLRQQTERLLNDARSQRFVDAFLDYWLDLRHFNSTGPDVALFPDYYLDDLLAESAYDETHLFFNELIRSNLPARTLIASDFTFVNERLAKHYQLDCPQTGTLRRVELPPDSVRGGLLAQAAVLKVTANGTTTSPVVRGAWVMERLLGQPPPPPPPSVPALEPDTRGATTIRQQLEKHRADAHCASCHARIDPAGFAMENFDVMGGWRDRYRAMGEGTPEPGFGKNGWPFGFHFAKPVEASATWLDGRTFTDIVSFKRLLLSDQRQIARNLVQQLVTYATGASVYFSDRPKVEAILDRTRSGDYPVRALIHEIVQSPLFLEK